MKTYDLYLDSGPMRKKTFVHVPALTGCIARGDTTEEAVRGAPEAISAYLRFLARHGEAVDPGAAFKIRVAEHITDGGWPGNGSGFLPADMKPLSEREAGDLLSRGPGQASGRLSAIHEDLRRLTAGMSARNLAAEPAKGRSIRRILSHIVGAEGGYLREIPGASRLAREVEGGAVDPHDALDRLLELETARVAGMSARERSEVVMRGHALWTARSAIRRMLEHAWEHYVEIAARLGEAT